jgi:hypothetical protein
MKVDVDDLRRCEYTAFRAQWRLRMPDEPYNPEDRAHLMASIFFAGGFTDGYTLGREDE